MHKFAKRSFAILLVVVLVMSMITVGITSVAAAGQTTITLKQGEELQYDENWGWTSVYMETASGEMIYCINPDKPAPSNGTYSTDDNHLKELTSSTLNYNLMRKALYYCYGGEGFKKSQAAFDNKTMEAYMGELKSNHWLGASGWRLHYLLTHIALSYISGYDNWNKTTYGDPFPTDWQNAVKELTTALKNAPSVPVTTKLYLLTINNNTQQVIIQKNSLKLQMQKTSANTALTNNNNCYSLEGAKYNLYLDKDCKNYFGYITTDATGYGKYGAGANGVDVSEQTYYAKEVEAPKGFALDTKVYTLTDSGKTAGGSKIYSFTCTDKPQSDPINVVVKKVDSKTGALTTALKDAEFTVTYYDTLDDITGKQFTRQWVIKTDGDGYAALDSEHFVSGDDFYTNTLGIIVMPIGTVTVQETKAPEGYKINPETFTQKINESGTGETINTFNEITVTETRAEGYVAIHKTDENGKAVSGAVYGLYNSNATDSNGNLIDSNKIITATTDTNGNATFDKSVSIGTYYIQEITAPTGFVRNKEIYPAIVTANNTTVDKAVKVEVAETNTKAEIIKYDEAGFALNGAVLQIIDANGKVVDEWTSTGDFHNITGKLTEGATYTLHEVSAPNGYVVADDQTFTVTSTTTIVTMTDKKTVTEIKKTDITGSKELAGAYLVVKDNAGNKVDEWVSTNEAHVITGLTTGATYTLSETIAPNGYTTADAVTFTVNTDGTTTKVVMKDDTTKAEILKVDEDGNALSGADLQILDKDNAIVNEWITDGTNHEITGKLTEGETYTLHEVSAPNGYVVAPDQTFKIGQGKTVVIMTDKITVTEITKTDITGEKELAGAYLAVTDKDNKVVDEWVSTNEVHIITGLTTGETYTLTESIAPAGYVIANPITFTINANGFTSVTMKDEITSTSFTKTDITGEIELPGASLTVTDKDGNVIDEWVSTDEAHTITGLTTGETYTLTEVVSPDGYTIANAVEFTVNDNGVTSVTMKDDTTKYSFTKVDEDGKPVKDAVLQILDKDGKVIDEWKTDGKTHEVIGKLIVGETYTLHEKTTPEGYETAKDIEFTVGNIADVQTISMVDKYNGDVTVSTPDQPTTSDSDSNGGAVQTGQNMAWFATITFAMIAAAILFGYARKRKYTL